MVHVVHQASFYKQVRSNLNFLSCISNHFNILKIELLRNKCSATFALEYSPNLNWLIQLRKGKLIKTGSFPVECPNWKSNLEITILLLRKAGSKERQKEAKWMKRDPRVLQQCATYHCLALIVTVIQYIRCNALDWLLDWILDVKLDPNPRQLICWGWVKKDDKLR